MLVLESAAQEPTASVVSTVENVVTLAHALERETLGAVLILTRQFVTFLNDVTSSPYDLRLLMSEGEQEESSNSTPKSSCNST